MNGFKGIKVGDPVWVVYDRNYKTRDGVVDLELVKGSMFCNRKERREIHSSDYWDDSVRVVYETYMEIKVDAFDTVYSGYLPNSSMQRGCRIMFPDFSSNSPEITVYASEDDAKNAIVSYNEDRICVLKKKIKDIENEISIKEESLHRVTV